MSVSLTVLQPHRFDVAGGVSNDFVSLFDKPRSFTPLHRVDSPVRQSLAGVRIPDVDMSTPHRGLPPPAAMALPDPHRTPAPAPVSHALGALPGPPQHWQGPEDAMRNWLAAKGEEDRRKQEEERTKQEGYRLEQRKIEQAMLREALQAGVPPTTIPMIYAGIGGSNLANITLELLQQYAAQLQDAVRHFQQARTPPEMPAEHRFVAHHPTIYAVSNPADAPPPAVHPSHTVEAAPATAPMQTVFAVYQPPSSAPQPAPRLTPQSQLPRLTTNEMYYPSPQQQGGIPSAHQYQPQPRQPPQQHDPSHSSPLYFHHWVPPAEGKSNLPQTPASRGEPHSAHPGSQLSDGDTKESPRKRKGGDEHQAAPAPTQVSPAFSAISMSSARRFAHTRTRSNTSTELYSRPESHRELETIRELPPRSFAADAGPSASSDERRSSSRHSAKFP